MTTLQRAFLLSVLLCTGCTSPQKFGSGAASADGDSVARITDVDSQEYEIFDLNVQAVDSSGRQLSGYTVGVGVPGKWFIWEEPLRGGYRTFEMGKQVSPMTVRISGRSQDGARFPGIYDQKISDLKSDRLVTFWFNDAD